ncbi:MAG: lipoyl synthase [Acidobacteriota bacterium]
MPDSRDPRRPAGRPDWLKVRLPSGETYFGLKRMMRGSELHTVCESALCPNIGDCWGSGTATFLILGNTCTRRCGYCAVAKGHPKGLDLDEPSRVAAAVSQMGIAHAVVTSVTRDDLPDGGAEAFNRTIRAIRQACPRTTIEVLVPDFRGRRESVQCVVDARPDVFNHNIETVPRLFRGIRPGADYAVSLDVLRIAMDLDSGMITKSGIMVGLGETEGELVAVFEDLHRAGCRCLTVGQYLQPSRKLHPVMRYYSPEEFRELKRVAEKIGFTNVLSGPLVRSSYHASVPPT